MYTKDMNETEFQQQAVQFLDKLFLQMANQSIVLENHWDIDHLCFRTSTEEAYQKFKSDFSNIAALLIESEVSGRLISTFKMHKPVQFKNWRIDVVELPAPKKGKVTHEGFEHIEIVTDLTFQEIQTKYPNCKYDPSGLVKDFNQELEIELEGCALKFHALSLESVVRLESNQPVYQALKKSNVLQVLKKYSPLVAGTFPLGIYTEKSDLDILISDVDFNFIEQNLTDHFSIFEKFNYQKLTLSDQPTVVVNFTFQNISFEIFAQNTPTIKQQAYLHYLIEEKLLKFGEDSLKQKIMNLRNSGFKTEPAFAHALGLSGDPYIELLNLQKMSNSKLQDYLHEHL